MTSEVKPIPHLLPIIGAGVAIGLVIAQSMLNFLQWISEGWQPLQSMTFWRGHALSMAGVGFAGFLLGLSILGWILQANLSKKSDFEHIPLILGINVLVLSSLAILWALIANVIMLVNIFDTPSSTIFYIAEAVLLLVTATVMSMGIIGGILLVKY